MMFWESSEFNVFVFYTRKWERKYMHTHFERFSCAHALCTSVWQQGAYNSLNKKVSRCLCMCICTYICMRAYVLCLSVCVAVCVYKEEGYTYVKRKFMWHTYTRTHIPEQYRAWHTYIQQPTRILCFSKLLKIQNCMRSRRKRRRPYSPRWETIKSKKRERERGRKRKF